MLQSVPFNPIQRSTELVAKQPANTTRLCTEDFKTLPPPVLSTVMTPWWSRARLLNGLCLRTLLKFAWGSAVACLPFPAVVVKNFWQLGSKASFSTGPDGVACHKEEWQGPELSQQNVKTGKPSQPMGKKRAARKLPGCKRLPELRSCGEVSSRITATCCSSVQCRLFECSSRMQAVTLVQTTDVLQTILSAHTAPAMAGKAKRPPREDPEAFAAWCEGALALEKTAEEEETTAPCQGTSLCLLLTP